MAQMDSARTATANGRFERVRQQEARRLARRSFLRVSVFAGVTLTVGTLLSGFLGFFNRLKPVGFGGVVTVATTRVPRPGQDPVSISEGKFWLVNLQGAQGDVLDVGGTGGVLALYWKCPHLGCSVPWNPTFDGGQVAFPGVVGWFRCPCHGSTYSRAGIRVFGPSPRPLDTMAVTLNPDGSLNVNTGAITTGAPDNPLRAVPYQA